jgi:hypothetical protein
MNNSQILIKVKQGLNKLDSMDYDNIECWQIFDAFNKVQKTWVRKQLHGYNLRKQGDEASKFSIDDLQVLLEDVPINSFKRDRYFDTELIPANYLYWKRVMANCVVECCDKRPLKIHLTEMANVEDMLEDEFKRPSSEWGETFATLIGNTIRIYTNNDFDIDDARLIYYRLPVDVRSTTCFDTSILGIPGVEVECEFKDDITEILIDETISLLGGNIESLNQYSINKQSSNEKS